jgi:protein associated with RNAse G/E
MDRLDKELEKEVKALEIYTKSKFGEFTTEFLSEKELGM